MLAAIIVLLQSGKDEQKTIITIAIAKNDMVKNLDTNYYKKWLEQKIGYKIQFVYMEQGYEKEYLYTMLTADKSSIDAVFLPNEDIFTMEEFKEYADRGLLTDLTSYMREDSNLHNILLEYQDYGLNEKMQQNGCIYYMPNMDTTRKGQNMQVMWINLGWLKKLGLQVPQTTEQLEEVLTAFLLNDPNGNGVKDELPLISCEMEYSLQSYNYLMNAFIYNDPMYGRIYFDESEELHFAPLEEEFREGIIYCKKLYEKGLLSNVCFDFTEKQIRELVNSQLDMVGAFTSQSISDVVYQNCPEVLARYIQIPPLEGPAGEKHAVWVNLKPRIGGYIPSNSTHKEEAFAIMDLMLSEEASLIAEYGEEGVDWKLSDKGDLSTYGSQAIITTINYIKDTVQNKNFAGVGPKVVKAEYINGVTWSGNNSLVEYIDARAVTSYEKYYNMTTNSVLMSMPEEEAKEYLKYSSYTDSMILAFVMGRLDATCDDVWNQYIIKYQEQTSE